MFDISILFAIEFGLFGIGITVFTVLYSFILNKKNELSVFTEQKKRQKNSIKTILDQKILFANKYILSAKKINFHLLILVFYTFAISILSFFAMGLKSFLCKETSEIVNSILTLLTVLSLIYILIMLIKVTIRYIKESKIE